MILFLRHASTTGQAPEADLTAKGHADAAALVPQLERLPITAIWSSPYTRALQTVAPFAARSGLDIRTDDRLQERRHGPVPDGMWNDEARQLFADPDATPWGGESRNQVLHRARSVLAEITEDGGTPLVACHGFWLSCILTDFGAPATESAWRSLPKPALLSVAKSTGITPLF